QGEESGGVGEHEARLMEGPDHVLSPRVIDGRLAADGGVDLGEERGRHPGEGDAAHVRRRRGAPEGAHPPPPPPPHRGAPLPPTPTPVESRWAPASRKRSQVEAATSRVLARSPSGRSTMMTSKPAARRLAATVSP